MWKECTVCVICVHFLWAYLQSIVDPASLAFFVCFASIVFQNYSPSHLSFFLDEKKKGLVVGNSTYNLHALVQNSFSSFLLYLPLLPVFGGSASLLHWLSHSWRRSPQPLQELRSQAWHGHKNWCGQMGPCYHWKRVQQSDCSATMLLRAVVFRQTKTTYLFKEQCARICCSAIALHW